MTSKARITTNSYTYDNDSQLTGSSGASDDSYGYDANGNQNSTGFTTGAGNEMTNSPGVTYTYDNDGNMITATTDERHDDVYVRLRKQANERRNRRDDGGDIYI